MFGDKDCVQLEISDPEEIKKRNHANRYVIPLFEWMQKKGWATSSRCLWMTCLKSTSDWLRSPPDRNDLGSAPPGDTSNYKASGSTADTTSRWKSSITEASIAAAGWDSAIVEEVTGDVFHKKGRAGKEPEAEW